MTKHFKIVSTRYQRGKYWKECKVRQRPFVAVVYTSRTKKYADVEYDFWTCPYDLTTVDAKTIETLMQDAIDDSYSKPEHMKHFRYLVFYAGQTSGRCPSLLAEDAKELAKIIVVVLFDDANHISLEWETMAKKHQKGVSA